jgi:hypothetical protein
LEALAEALAVALLPFLSRQNYPLLFSGFLLVGFEVLAFHPQILLRLFFQALAFHHWALAFRQASGLYRLYLGLRDYALCLDLRAYA